MDFFDKRIKAVYFIGQHLHVSNMYVLFTKAKNKKESDTLTIRIPEVNMQIGINLKDLNEIIEVK